MKTTKMLTILVLALGLMVGLAQVSQAGPMGTAFTYQGRLMDANDTAQGIYDMMYHLYDSPEGPNEIGVTDIQDVEVPDSLWISAAKSFQVTGAGSRSVSGPVIPTTLMGTLR